MSLKALLASLDPHEDEGDSYWVRIANATWSQGGVALKLAIHDNERSGDVLASWHVRCEEVREFLISDVNGGGLNFFEESHIALRLISEDRASLYFTGKAPDPFAIIGALYHLHRDVCDDWKPFDAYLNRPADLPELLADGYGLLASGPVFLMEKYAEIVQRVGLRTSITDRSPAKYWDGADWIKQAEYLKLLHLGESYIIAERFNAQRE
jgi:hypothetical protein